MTSDIVKFYCNESNPNGLALEFIWGWHDMDLERIHNYIQWLFPLDEPSECVPDAPVLTEQDIEIFKNNIKMQSRLVRSFETMLKFYGYSLYEDPHGLLSVVSSDHWNTKIDNWMTPGNHNYLRITRILRSMTLLGRPELAKKFLVVLRYLWNRNAVYFGNQKYEEGCTLWYWEQACEL